MSTPSTGTGNVAALKTFFGSGKDTRPVTNAELLDLRKADPAGFDELARLAKAALADARSTS